MKKLIKAMCLLAAVQRINGPGIDRSKEHLEAIAHSYYKWVMNDATD